MTEKALEIQDLTVTFHESDFSLSHIHLEVQTGVITGLLGRNGAGKTTLLKTIMGTQKYTEGSITYFQCANRLSGEEVKKRIGFASHTPLYNTNYTPHQILKALLPLYPNFLNSLFHKYMASFHLDHDTRIGDFSAGMQRKYQILLEICCNPDLLILDEPTANLDAISQDDVLDMCMDFMQNERKSILLSSNLTQDIQRLADYVALMDQGSILLMDEKDALLERYRIFHYSGNQIPKRLQELAISVKQTDTSWQGLIDSEAVPFLTESQNTDIYFSRPGFTDLMRYLSY